MNPFSANDWDIRIKGSIARRSHFFALQLFDSSVAFPIPRAVVHLAILIFVLDCKYDSNDAK
jgi:hypothetical protein